MTAGGEGMGMVEEEGVLTKAALASAAAFLRFKFLLLEMWLEIKWFPQRPVLSVPLGHLEHQCWDLSGWLGFGHVCWSTAFGGVQSTLAHHPEATTEFFPDLTDLLSL
jgi:hypothetical protein